MIHRSLSSTSTSGKVLGYWRWFCPPRNGCADFARNGFVLLLTLFGITFVVACGGSSSSSPPGEHSSSGFGTGSLNGTYVFSSTASNLSDAPLFLTTAGSLTANGSGGITRGTVDLIGGKAGVSSPAAQPITGGSYKVGPDGRGQISFDTTTRAGAVSITLDFVLISSSHGLVTEFDSNGTGSGTIDLQSAITQSQLAGSYVLCVSGTGANGTSPTAAVGAFTLDSTGAVSTGQEDVNNSGSYSGAPSQILTKSAVTLGTTPATATIASSAVLSGYPLILGRSDEAGSPENFVHFRDRKTSDLAQASRESRFA
jgi:hypothetical protein